MINGQLHRASHKSGRNLDRVKRSGPDKDYGETDAQHGERVDRLTKKHKKDKESVAIAHRKINNRSAGIHRAGKILAKEEVSFSESEIEFINSIMNTEGDNE
jgi:hypothetical protein